MKRVSLHRGGNRGGTGAALAFAALFVLPLTSLGGAGLGSLHAVQNAVQDDAVQNAVQSAAQATTGEPPTVRAHPLGPDDEIQIDGHLNESVWFQAEAITEMYQEEPVEGGAPSEPSEIYVLYDQDNLYIGAILYDSDPSGVIAHKRLRNDGLGTDDRFMWLLDTFNDGRTGYFFETNPAGLMGDGILSGSGLNKSWDGIWEIQTQVTDIGWTVEIRIPFRTLNFDPAAEAWGINFQRTIRRKNEEIRWSGWRRNQRLSRPSDAGRLVGLEGISQGVGLEVKPYASGNWSHSPALDDPRDGSSKIGGDLQYNFTPSLRGALSINTDFAEVEVDDRLVNLSRFPVSLPERRDFFLEGSGVFGFAPRQGVDAFFSRRIGLVQGEEIPIELGARLGGQVGAYDLGFFQVRTGRGEAVLLDGATPRSTPAEDFTAARVRRGIFSQSNVGALYTRRATHELDEQSPPDRHTIGFDFDLTTSEFRDEYNLQFAGFFLWHTDPVREGSSTFADRRSRGVRLSFPNDVLRFRASLRDFGDAVDPAVGFVPRNGYRRFQPVLGYHPRVENVDWLRQVDWDVAFEYLTSLEGTLLTREVGVTLLGLNFESGDQLSIGTARRFERLQIPFDIRDGIEIPASGYDTSDWSLSVRSAGRRAVSGNMDLSRGGFWSGSRRQFQSGGTLRPLPGVSFSTEYERNEVRLEEGRFDTNLVRFAGEWGITPLRTVTTSLQYDDISEVVGLYSRVRWTVHPGNDIFFVYTHNWRNDAERLFDRHLNTVSQGAAVKVNYTYRF